MIFCLIISLEDVYWSHFPVDHIFQISINQIFLWCWPLKHDNLSHKSHNASIPYPTMHHFVTEMCTCVHISVTKWCIVGYLSDWCIVGFFLDGSIGAIPWQLMPWLLTVPGVCGKTPTGMVQTILLIWSMGPSLLCKSSSLNSEKWQKMQI